MMEYENKTHGTIHTHAATTHECGTALLEQQGGICEYEAREQHQLS